MLFPLDFAGTLCARDGIKTGPSTPNGEDAYDRKLVVMRVRKRQRVLCFENHGQDSRVHELNYAITKDDCDSAFQRHYPAFRR